METSEQNSSVRAATQPDSLFGPGALLVFAVVAGSTAVIMIKASTEQALLVASYRLLVAALVLSPFFWREWRRHRAEYGWRQVGWAFFPAVALAVHFMSWVIGARMTLTANASLFVNMSPLALPFFLWIFYREKLRRAEVIGTLFALSGVLLLTGSSVQLSMQNFLGDVICFGSMLAFACYLALGRRNSGRINIWLYIVPLYTMAGLMCLAVAVFFVNPIKTYTTANLLYMLGLGIIPTVIGHTLLNTSMKYFRGQVVGIANLGQIVFAGAMAALFFGEVPAPIYYAAAALILTGILIGIFGNKRDSAKIAS